MILDALLIQISTSYLHKEIRKNEPQLGQYYIAEYASQCGYNVKVKKYSTSKPILEDLIALARDTHARIIGFYVDSENLWIIRRLLYDIKKNLEHVFVVLGGPQVTGNPELALKRVPYADCAIIGEGEVPFSRLLALKDFRKDVLAGIPGVAFYNHKQEFISSPPILADINSYKFPKRHQYTLDDVTFDHISTGRGCVGRCAFCFEGSKSNTVLRLRSVESVIEEIDYVVNNLKNQQYISFLDDTFIIDRKRTELICNHLITKYSGKIKWFCEARVDILYKNLDLIPLMISAGMSRVQLGGESGTQEILNLYNKNMQLDELKEVIRHLYAAGIDSIYVNFIVGGAKETFESFNNTLELAKEILHIAPLCAEVGSSLFSPYVGTPMYNNPDKYGIKIIDKNLVTGPDGHTPFVETEELSRFEIMKLFKLFEAEISKTYFQIIERASTSQIFKLYNDAKLGMATTWYEKCTMVENIHNYFESILSGGFQPLTQLDSAELEMSVPFRTSQPVSDGEFYYREVFPKKYVKNSEFENIVYMLSAGKLCFVEIIDVVLKSYPAETRSTIRDMILNVYQKFDKEHMVIWKNKF